MTIEQLKTIHQARPFRPFTLYLADGRQVHVPHHEFLSHSPTGRTVVVHHTEEESFSILDLLLVTELKLDPAKSPTDSNGSGKRKKH
jgi:hypothetical protein